MEHSDNTSMHSLKDRFSLSDSAASKLVKLGYLIHTENGKYNLTGHKSLEDIIQNLILESIAPITLSDVPRGTSAADMGTGAGIPGIPLAILYPEIQFTLFDSNSKKIRFIDYVVNELSLKNIKGVCCRIEEAARDTEYRESFDMIFSRAMSDVYMAGELCSPYLKPEGCLYLYVSDKQKELPSPVIEHLEKLSLEIIHEGKTVTPWKISTSSGLLLQKTSHVADIYPRRISAIKRGVAEVEKNKQ